MAIAYVPAPFPCPIDGCDVFPYDTAEDLAAHLATHGRVITSRPTAPLVITSRPTVIDRRGRFETVTNGFGGTTTRTIDRPKVEDPPTAKQTAYLRVLLTERAGVDAAEKVRDDLNRRREAGQLTRVVVSEAIDRLLAIRRPRKDEGTPQRFDRQLPDVAQGHYAIASSGSNDLAFYRVDRPTEGTYAGGTFVKLVVGGKPDANVPFRNVAGILARIVEAGMSESALLYGQEIGRCYRCNRHLTDQTSRSLGIGPECRTK